MTEGTSVQVDSAEVGLLSAVEEFSRIRRRPCLVLKTSISRNLCLLVQEQLAGLSGDAVDVVMRSWGGDPDAAFILIRNLRRRFSELGVIVPLEAKSAATLICLGASELIVGDMGELGPLDTQLAEAQDRDSVSFRSALDRFKALESIRQYALESVLFASEIFKQQFGFKSYDAAELGIRFASVVSEPLFERIDPLRVGESHRALQIAEQYGLAVLTRYRGLQMQEASTILDQFVKGYSHHGFVIDREALHDIGLPVRAPTTEEAGPIDGMAAALLSAPQMVRAITYGPEPLDEVAAPADGHAGAVLAMNGGDSAKAIARPT